MSDLVFMPIQALFFGLKPYAVFVDLLISMTLKDVTLKTS